MDPRPGRAGYLRGATLVARFDAMAIGAGLVNVSVLLAAPLAILTSFSGFVLVIGRG